jgi:hypothetical protein
MDEHVVDVSHAYLTGHRIALAMGRLAAERLSLERIAEFRRFIERAQERHGESEYLRLWIDIVDRGPEALREVLAEPSERGQVLRSAISFRAFVTKDERDEIVRRYTRSGPNG